MCKIAEATPAQEQVQMINNLQFIWSSGKQEFRDEDGTKSDATMFSNQLVHWEVLQKANLGVVLSSSEGRIQKALEIVYGSDISSVNLSEW